MQDSATLVAESLAQMAEAAVGFVHQDQRIRICHNGVVSQLVFVPEFIHANNLKLGSPPSRVAWRGTH